MVVGLSVIDLTLLVDAVAAVGDQSAPPVSEVCAVLLEAARARAVTSSPAHVSAPSFTAASGFGPPRSNRAVALTAAMRRPFGAQMMLARKTRQAWSTSRHSAWVGPEGLEPPQKCRKRACSACFHGSGGAGMGGVGVSCRGFVVEKWAWESLAHRTPRALSVPGCTVLAMSEEQLRRQLEVTMRVQALRTVYHWATMRDWTRERVDVTRLTRGTHQGPGVAYWRNLGRGLI